MLFFRGFAGENSAYGFSVHDTFGSAYVTQEVNGSRTATTFALPWVPSLMRYANDTGRDATQRVKFNLPPGLSGSLVWNTRYQEVTLAGGTWHPNDAVVTGLLYRWDEGERLHAISIDRIKAWIDGLITNGDL
jgi:hypothetical protein